MKDERDPINNIKDLLMEMNVKEEDLKTIDKEIKTIIKDAATFAQESPEPPLEDLWTDVLVEGV